VCVHTTIREANDLGYECLLVEDATNAATRQNHNSAISMVRKSGGIFGATATTDKVIEVLSTLPDCYLYDEKVDWKVVADAPKLKAVSVGKDEEVWGLTSKNEIYKKEGGNWKKIEGSLRQISVGSKQNVWGVNNKLEIFRWSGKEWQNIQGHLKQVSAGADGSVWGVDVDDQVFRYEGNSWKQAEGISLKQIAVADAKNIWGVNSNNEVFQYQADTKAWVRLYGRLKQISCSVDGSVYGVDPEDDVFRLDEGQWVQVQGNLKQVSNSDEQVWGTDATDQVKTFSY